MAVGAVRAGARLARSRWAARWLAAALLILFLWRLDREVAVHSPTNDEAFHIAAGHAYLNDRDFRINLEHPPPVKMWAAASLIVMVAH